ncbi:MAG TPA: DegV family protein [Eubacterium sp.]|nr:DegV family protein [Eubacterium sp.]
MDYVLSCCSGADLSKEYVNRRNIAVTMFHYELDDVEYEDDFGESLPFEELYERMIAGASTKTSQISIGQYIEYFEGFLSKGQDVLHITLSSGISGTYNSACLAQRELMDKYPDRTLYIVDSLGASSGYGLLMDRLADKRDEGMNIDALYQYAMDNRLKVNSWFYSSDLTFFIRGGRVSKTAGFFGQMLNICPLLNINYEGKLIPREKVRGKKRVIERTFELMKEYAEDRENYRGKCFISHSLREEEARQLADMIEAYFPNMAEPVSLYPIGATIGSHTGPGTVALFFWGDERWEEHT